MVVVTAVWQARGVDVIQVLVTMRLMCLVVGVYMVTPAEVEWLELVGAN
jgi:hypothetical protein